MRMRTKYTKNCDGCHWKYENGVAINIYNICKGRLGSRGGGGEWAIEAKEDIKHLTKIDHVYIVHQLFKYIYSMVNGCLFT